MAFVRTKRVGGREYYQLVESYRENDKVRQRVLAHLGRSPTVEAAIEDLERYERAERERGWTMHPKTRVKLRELRRLVEEGKARPGPPEMKAQREREHERREALERHHKFFEDMMYGT